MDTSSTSSTTSVDLEKTIHQAGMEILQKNGKLDLALKGLAVESIRKGLNWEQKMVEGKETQNGDDDSMMILGDLNLNQEPKKDDTTGHQFLMVKWLKQ